MRTDFAAGVQASLLAPMPPACPTCNELMMFKSAKPWTLVYGHQLDQYTFECGECGYVTTRMFAEDGP